jgi:F0F1-type ATP synthase assembly protein I
MANSGGAGKRGSKSLQALVKAEKLTQIAFILPVSVVVGWLLGVALDKWLHTHWLYLVGLLLGVTSGLLQVFRMVNSPSTFVGTAPDPSVPPAPSGAGFGKGFEDESKNSGKWDKWDN